MKIKYTAPDGKTLVIEMSKDQENVEIEVCKDFFMEIKEFKRITSNRNRAERRKRYSLELMQAMGHDIDAPDLDADPTRDIEERETIDALKAALEQLPQKQRLLIQKVFYEGKSLTCIAREEDVSNATITRRLTAIYEQIKTQL